MSRKKKVEEKSKEKELEEKIKKIKDFVENLKINKLKKEKK